MVEAAWSAVQNSARWREVYEGIKKRRQSKRAIVAVAHSILQSVYYLLVRHEPYQELGGNFFDKVRSEDITKRLVARLEQLGHKVTLETPQAA